MLFIISLIIIGIVIYKKRNRKNKEIFSTFNPELDRRVQFLLKQFVLKKLTIKKDFVPPKDFKNINPETLEKILNKILDHMKLKKNVFLVYHSGEEEAFKNKAGTYDQGCLGNRAINLVINPKYSMEDYISILAHECAHHFMNVYDFKIEKQSENEKNTDTLAILLGFGKFLSKTHRFRTFNVSYKGTFDKYETNKLGYLLPYEVDYIIHKHQEILRKGRKQKENFKSKVKVEEKKKKVFKSLDKKLEDLKKEYRENKLAINNIPPSNKGGSLESKWDFEKISKLIHKYENDTYSQHIDFLRLKVKDERDQSKVIESMNKLKDELRKDRFFINKYLKE